MNFINAMNKGKRIRLKTDIAMWEEVGYYNYWFNVKQIRKKGNDYFGISIKDILNPNWEIKKGD